MRCIASLNCGFGGGGMVRRPAAGWAGRGLVGRRGEVAAPPWAAPALSPSEKAMGVLETAAHGGASVSSPATFHRSRGGGGGGKGGEGERASAASAVGLPSDGTPGSRRVEHDLHPAAPPPDRHKLADREPRPSVGVAPRAGVLVLRGWQGRPRGLEAPPTTRRTPAGWRPAPRRGLRAGPKADKRPIDPEDAPDEAAVGDTRLMAPGAFCLLVPPLDQEYSALGCAGLGPRGG